MNLIEKIKRVVLNELDRVYTVDIGIITNIDYDRMRCDVKLKHRIDGNEIALKSVPLAGIRFDNNFIFLTPKVGEPVVLIFNKYELEELVKDNVIKDVNQRLQFHLNNAIAIAGLFTVDIGQLPTEDFKKGGIFIYYEGAQITLTELEIGIDFRNLSKITLTDKSIAIETPALVVKAGRVDFMKRS